MKNIKLTIQYDGFNYHGWQIQPNGITVQEVLQNALLELTNEQISVVGCGRTDAGVHAISYVCNFKTNSSIPADRFCYALNTKLPDDIVCKSSQEVSDDFNSKYSAIKKNYIYKILNSDMGDAFLSHRAWHIREKLDIKKMNCAAQYFVGTHDFIGFASSGFTVKTTIRTIYSASVYEQNGLIVVDLVGNGFLYNMVRIITGTLYQVGTGKIKPDDIGKIIDSKCRKNAGITAPPDGLYLLGVEY